MCSEHDFVALVVVHGGVVGGWARLLAAEEDAVAAGEGWRRGGRGVWVGWVGRREKVGGRDRGGGDERRGVES